MLAQSGASAASLSRATSAPDRSARPRHLRLDQSGDRCFHGRGPRNRPHLLEAHVRTTAATAYGCSFVGRRAVVLALHIVGVRDAHTPWSSEGQKCPVTVLALS